MRRCADAACSSAHRRANSLLLRERSPAHRRANSVHASSFPLPFPFPFLFHSHTRVLGEFVVAATKTFASDGHAGSCPTPAPAPGGSNHSTTHAPSAHHASLASDGGGGGGAHGDVEEACFGDGPNYFGAFVAILTVIALKMLYFELSDSIRPSSAQTQQANGPRHALQRGFFQAVLWNFGHAPLFVAMLCIAAVLEGYVSGECMTDPNIVLLSSATSIVVLTLTCMGLAHSSGEPRTRAHRGMIRKQLRTIARVAFALAALATSVLTLWVTHDAAENSWKTHIVAVANTLVLGAAVVFDSVGRCPVAVPEEARAAYAAEQRAKAAATKERSPSIVAPVGGFEALNAPLIQHEAE